MSFTEDQLFPYAVGTSQGLYQSPGGTKEASVSSQTAAASRQKQCVLMHWNALISILIDLPSGQNDHEPGRRWVRRRLIGASRCLIKCSCCGAEL